MAELQFTNSQRFERFYSIFHIAALVVCVIMGVMALFGDNGFIYVPPIFAVCGLMQIVNAIDALHCIRRSDRRTRLGIMLIILGLIFFVLTFVTAKAFWFS